MWQEEDGTQIYLIAGWFLVRRQTVLFSATQTRNVEDLARVSLKKSPLYVGVDDHRETSTVEGLEQVERSCIWYCFVMPKFFSIVFWTQILTNVLL